MVILRHLNIYFLFLFAFFQKQSAYAEPLFVREVAGNCLIKSKQTELIQKAEIGIDVHHGTLIITANDAHLELTAAEPADSKSLVIRMAPQTVLELLADRSYKLHEGALLLYIPQNETVQLLPVLLEAGTVIVEKSENQGLKLINLERRFTLKNTQGDKRRLKPGQLTFYLPDDSFATTLDYFMLEFLHTSMLVQGFKQPLPTQQRIINEALIQRDFLRGATNSYVGDAISTDQFQIYEKK